MTWSELTRFEPFILLTNKAITKLANLGRSNPNHKKPALGAGFVKRNKKWSPWQDNSRIFSQWIYSD